LESTWVNDLAATSRWALAATDYGITQIDLKDGVCRTWTVFDGLWSNSTTSVAVDGDTAWVGTDHGVCKLFLPKGPIKRLSPEALHSQTINRITADSQYVWLGGELGLYRLDRATDQGFFLGNEGGVGGPVYALSSTPEEIWVGRLTGVELVEKKTLKQTGYPAQAHFGGAEVNAILAQEHLVWVGTDRGLWKFDRKRNYWHQYTEVDGLLDNRVYALYPDGDYILIGTQEGLTRFYWDDPDRVD
jgi:ligand-binding sensor domain-containing protein